MADRVFIIEDDAALATELSHLLVLNAFEVGVCSDFQEAARQALDYQADCILLDLVLPNADGQLICREIRKSSSVPIIVLTSKSDEFTEVMCLKLGASDFIAKPYRPAALLARIWSLIQRNATSGIRQTIEHEGLTLDIEASTVSFKNKTRQITRNEQRILALLMRNAGKIVSRQEIMCDLWESDAFIDDNTLTVNINRLRNELHALGVPKDFIQTRRSLGYVIE